MDTRIANALIFLLCLAVNLSCVIPNKRTLTGMTLYKLDNPSKSRRIAGAMVTLSMVAETKYTFIDENIVEIVPTVFYNFPLPSMLPDEFTPDQRNYIYKDEVLSISDEASMKLVESDSFFIADNGETFYKTSILALNNNSKAARLRKVAGAVKDVEKDYLEKESVVKSK